MRLFSQSAPLLRSASWTLPTPALFEPGGGPTIVHAVDVSKRAEDVRLVSAAANGDVAAVAEALQEASHVDVHVRLPRTCSSTRATTALHAASAAGAIDVVQLLLQQRADVMGRHGHFRALTPLHDAASVEVAAVLLAAKASPIPLDPREPDAGWYHEQRSRGSIAALIRQRRAEAEREHRAARARLQPPPSLLTAQIQGTTPRRQLPAPPMSSAELISVRSAWLVDGASVMSMLPRSPSAHALEEGIHREDRECSICMIDLMPEDDVLLLPCGNFAGSSNAAGKVPTGKPHAFHSECLERWLMTKSAACPICRTNLRAHLRPGAARPSDAVSASPPRRRSGPTGLPRTSIHVANLQAVDGRTAPRGIAVPKSPHPRASGPVLVSISNPSSPSSRCNMAVLAAHGRSASHSTPDLGP
eukprot:TRINITY_DN77673_c0_g1_i1.p1 TRINITY_DN77673_c0_g1~~TRINITY_DN77673_c0_g1_i1.p1  ORF type:complete len:417 (-),score=76.49 TRINITY_DN77673_c0_g1_i1:32-1282(-)